MFDKEDALAEIGKGYGAMTDAGVGKNIGAMTNNYNNQDAAEKGVDKEGKIQNHG